MLSAIRNFALLPMPRVAFSCMCTCRPCTNLDSKTLLLLYYAGSVRFHSRTSADNTQRTSSHSVAPTVVFVAVFAAAGLAFYNIQKRQKCLENDKHFAENEYQTPFVDSKTGLLIQFRGAWFPNGMFFSVRQFNEIKNFELYENDVLVVSFPKSGTTWIQQIVWLICSGLYAEKDQLNMEQRFPYLEYVYPGLKEIVQQKSPRLIKSHLPYSFLPAAVEAGHGKVIYIARNVKDVCVSYYHFYRMLSTVKYHGSFGDFFQLFLSGRVAYGPWLAHVSEFWRHRADNNILFLRYEDLHQHPEEVVRRVAEFLGHTLSAEQVSSIVQQTQFSVMKDDPSVNYSWWDEYGLRLRSESQFLRKGLVGDWVNHMSPAMAAELNEQCTVPLQQQGLVFTDRTL